MTDEHWNEVRSAFEGAARWFVAVTASGADRWDGPGLGEWSVRDLVGHTSRALSTVENYLDGTARHAQLTSAGRYFTEIFAASGDPAAVAQRGRDAGAALGPDLAAAVTTLADRVLPRIARERPDALVTTPVGGMRLVDYLPTRTFELTVHTCDLAAALDQPLDVPPGAFSASLTVLGELAVQPGHAAALLLAATGRRPLPRGFTVL